MKLSSTAKAISGTQFLERKLHFRKYDEIYQKWFNEKSRLKRQRRKAEDEFTQKRLDQEITSLSNSIVLLESKLNHSAMMLCEAVKAIDEMNLSLHQKSQLLSNNHIAIQKITGDDNPSFSQLITMHAECAGEDYEMLDWSMARDFPLHEAFTRKHLFRITNEPEYRSRSEERVLNLLDEMNGSPVQTYQLKTDDKGNKRLIQQAPRLKIIHSKAE